MTFENRYSAMDRLLHRVAFVTGPAQIALADIEDRIFARQLADIETKQPAFVTALPRAGTTLLLELCCESGEFASHSYRDMPFVLNPMLWDRFAAKFRRDGEARERAHGDGVMVNVDSPEAFEEMVWKLFWRSHYKKDRIVPWQAVEDDPYFFEVLRSHIRKVIAVRKQESGEIRRYVSKNNLNIARIELLLSTFADAAVLVPFRHPQQQAASLLRQHLNFLDIHRKDKFAREYMAAIGHYEFGENLKPVDFNGWVGRTSADPATLAFWVEYWVNAYECLLETARRQTRVSVVSYERLCDSPPDGLRKIGTALGARSPGDFGRSGSKISRMRPHPVDLSDVDRSLVNRAEALHVELLAASIT